MAEFLNHLIFGIYPYIALAVLAIGSIIRYDREPYSWRAGSSQLLRRKQLMIGSLTFHLGVLVIFFGHLGGLLTPIALFDAVGISHSAKQILAIVAGGVAGVLALFGSSLLLHRRLFDARIRRASSFSDIAILFLLWLQLILGLGTIFISLDHLDGHEMVKFMSWAQGIFTFQGDASSFVADAHWIFKLHLFLGADDISALPFHPSGPHAVGTGAIHLALGLSDCAQ